MDSFETRVLAVVSQFAWPAAAPLSLGCRLMDMGIDSMSVISLALALEVEFGVSLPGEMFTAEIFDTTTSLAAALRGLCNCSAP